MYYDKEGQPLTQSEWRAKFKDWEYKRVAQTTLPDGKWVSTVWLGLDHNFSSRGLPLIFETIAFLSEDNLEELDMERYATLVEAQRGHADMVLKYAPKKEA